MNCHHEKLSSVSSLFIIVHHIHEKCMFDSCGNRRLTSWFFMKQNICLFMACKTFIISPLNVLLVFFNFDWNFWKQASIEGILFIVGFASGILPNALVLKKILKEMNNKMRNFTQTQILKIMSNKMCNLSLKKKRFKFYKISLPKILNLWFKQVMKVATF